MYVRFAVAREDSGPVLRPRRRIRWLAVLGVGAAILAALAEAIIAGLALLDYLTGG